MPEHKVIGYAAAMSKTRFFAHAGTLLIVGDEDTLRACIVSKYRKQGILSRYRFRKIRYWEMMLWLNNGSSLSLDETSYNRFAEVALENGKKLKYSKFPEDVKETAHGVPVIKIRNR